MRIREIARGLQFPEGPVVMDDGSVVLVEIARGTITRVRPDGTLQVLAQPGGGPNGLARGPGGDLFITNNGGFEWHRGSDGSLRPIAQANDYAGGRIERLNLASGRLERVYDRFTTKTGETATLRGPNDLVFDTEGGLWFTDLGKGRARELDRGGVYYARADGSAITEVIYPALTPNGIGLSPDGRTLYFAETEGARLWAADIQGPGEVRKHPFPFQSGARQLAQPGGAFQRFDSLKVDASGHILVATLINGGITRISPDGTSISHTPLPDPYVTNLCFGGPDLRTLYVTLSHGGSLIAIDDWPEAGLRLAYS
jgi:gluconolactonase